MTMVGGLDVHRQQITFDYVDDDGVVHWGQIRPATRQTLRGWLAERCGDGDAEFALEGCTGWRYVCEELAAAGVGVHLGDPAEIAALRGPKKRAKTDRADARLLRILLVEGRFPESWIPPAHVVEMRTLGRLYCTLMDERRAWLAEHCPEGDAEMAVEGCTGWRYVVEELAAAGGTAHLADPAETAGLRGPKKRAKTDRADARLLRTLLLEGRLPESWIPPAHVLEVRTLGRLYCALMEERRGLAAAHPRPVVSPGLPTDRGVAVGGGLRCARRCRAVAGGAPACGYRVAAH